MNMIKNLLLDLEHERELANEVTQEALRLGLDDFTVIGFDDGLDHPTEQELKEMERDFQEMENETIELFPSDEDLEKIAKEMGY